MKWKFGFGEMGTCRQDFVVISGDGIHARPATLIVKALMAFDVTGTATVGAKSINVKSVLEWLSLEATEGAMVCIQISGKDATLALRELELRLSGVMEPLPCSSQSGDQWPIPDLG